MQALSDLCLTAADKYYPNVIHFPHALMSIVSYRQWRAKDLEPSQWFADLFISFYSHSQGGGCANGMLWDGKALLSYFTRGDYTYFHIAAYLCAYWSPRDFVFRMLLQPRNPVRLFCVAMDNLDAATTCCAVADQAVKARPDNALAPLFAGICLYNTGAAVRLVDQIARGRSLKSFLAEPTRSGVLRGALTAAVYYVLGHLWRGGKHRNGALVFVSLTTTLLNMLEDMLDTDAFDIVARKVNRVLAALSKNLQLGPQAA